MKLETFISTRTLSMSERDASAVVNALLSLFENKVHPYTKATGFLHSRSSRDPFSDSSSVRLERFMDEVTRQYPSLSPTLRRLHVMAVLRCAQARGSKYKMTYDDRHCWPYNSVDVPLQPFQYSELRPFWKTISEFAELDSASAGSRVRLRSLGSFGSFSFKPANATEANQGITLFSLCIFFWEAVRDPQGHFTASV
ncbi:hypothetical protein C8J56DRAFT_976928, partial [Mycena floridula]